jgi:hypothetical protein
MRCHSQSRHHPSLPGKAGKHHRRRRSTMSISASISAKTSSPSTHLDAYAISDFDSTSFRTRTKLVNNPYAFVSTHLPRLCWIRHYSNIIPPIHVRDEAILRPRQEFSITPMSEWQTPECVLRSSLGQPVLFQLQKLQQN